MDGKSHVLAENLMFRDQFKLTKREEMAVADICQFTILIYLKAWFMAPSAPSTDLQLLIDIHIYKQQNRLLSELAMKKMTGHLWYLSDKLIALALSDDNVLNDTKRLMVRGLQTPSAHAHPPPKRITLNTATIETKKLEDFVTQNTHSSSASRACRRHSWIKT